MTDHPEADRTTEHREHNDGGDDHPRNPTGILEIMPDGARSLIFHALLDMRPRKEFNKSELAERADVSWKTANRHLRALESMTVVERVEDTRRYRLNEDSPVTRALIELNDAVNRVATDDLVEAAESYYDTTNEH